MVTVCSVKGWGSGQKHEPFKTAATAGRSRRLFKRQRVNLFEIPDVQESGAVKAQVKIAGQTSTCYPLMTGPRLLGGCCDALRGLGRAQWCVGIRLLWQATC